MGNRIRSSECSYELQCTIVLNSISHVLLCGVHVFEILQMIRGFIWFVLVSVFVYIFNCIAMEKAIL